MEMKKQKKNIYSRIKHMAAALAMMLMATGAGAQTVMQNGTTLTVTAAGCSSGFIVDDGGADGIYSNSFHGTVQLQWAAGDEMHLSGNFNTENCCDYLDISYVHGGQPLTANYRGIGVVDLTADGGSMTITFHTDGSVVRDGFELMWSISSSASSCSNAVTGLTATLTDDTTVVLSWNGDPAAHYAIDGGTVKTVSTTNNATIGGLSGATLYTFTVYDSTTPSACCAATTSIRTGCADVKLPFGESFEDCAIGQMPDCWLKQANFDNAATQPQVVSTTASDGVNSLMLTSGSNAQGGHYGVVATPTIATNGDEVTTTLMLYATHWGTKVVVGTLPAEVNGNDTSEFERIETITLDNEGSWQAYTITWQRSETRARLALMMKQSDQDGTGRRVYIDMPQTALCQVTDLQPVTVRDTFVTISWNITDGTTATVGVRHPYDLTDSLTFSGVTSPLTIADLDPETYYLFTIYPDCEGSNAGITVRTEAGPIPSDGFCSGFNGQNGLPAGWLLHAPNYSCYNYSTDNGVYLDRGCNYELPYFPMLCSPRLSGLPGKTVSVRTNYYGYGDHVYLIAGTVRFPDDTTTFSPIDTLVMNGNVWIDSVFSFTIPADDTNQSIALKVTSDWAYSINISGVYIGSEPYLIAHEAHGYDTCIEVRWNTVVDSAIIEYGHSGFTLGTGHRDTVTATDRATLCSDIWPYNGYDVYLWRPDQTPCADFKNYIYTQGYGHGQPYCSEIATVELFSRDWGVIESSNNGYPSIMQHPHYYNVGNTLSLFSYGFEDSYNNTVHLPDLRLDTGAVMSFYATASIDTSWLVVGYFPYHKQRFIPTDTIMLGANRHHYLFPLADSVAGGEGRLALRWFHRHQYEPHYLYIDELTIDTAAYGNVSMAFVGVDSAVLHLDTLIGADSILLNIVGGSIDTTLMWTPGNGDLPIGGLDSGTLYLVYVTVPADTTAGCPSYAVYFITNATGTFYQECFTFDELLSYELPTGWHFTDSARVDDGILVFTQMAALYPLGNRNGTSFVISKPDDDTLFFGYTLDSVDFYPTDTITARMSTFILHDMPTDTSFAMAIKAHGSDTARVDMLGIFACPIVDFKSEGGRLICTMRNGDETPDYMLTVQRVGYAESQTYHVTTSPFEIANLMLGATYQVSYQCVNYITSCAPAYLVTIENRINLPYCERFATMPQNWDFLVDDDVTNFIDYGWGEVLSFGGWGRPRQIAVLPPTFQTGSMTVELYAHVWDYNSLEIGTIDSSLDTSTFVPLTNNGQRTSWITMTAQIDSIGSRRVALRSNSLAMIDRVAMMYGTVKVSRYTPRTVTVKVSGTDQPVYLRYADGYGTDSIITIDTATYEITAANHVEYFNLTRVMDTAGNGCDLGIIQCRLSDTLDIPTCVDDYTPQEQWLMLPNNDVPYFNYLNGRYSFEMYNTWDNQTTRTSYMLMPYLDGDASQYHIGFYMTADYAYDTIEVGVMTDAYDSSTFVPIDTVTNGDNTYYSWAHHQTSLAGYSGNGRWIAFRHRNKAGTSSNRAYLSWITLSECPNMFAARTASAVLTSWNTATISAIDSGFYVEYGPTGFTPDTGTLVRIDSLPFALTLDPTTTYDIYFRCDSNTLVCNAAPTTVTTLDPPITVPACIDFDTNTVGLQPASWAATNGCQITVTDQRAHSGANSMATGTSYSASYLYSPEIDVDTLSNYMLDFWFYGKAIEWLNIATTNIPHSNNGSYTVGGTYSSHGEWVHVVVDLSEAPDNARALRFNYWSSDYGADTLYIDDLHLGQCAAYGLHPTNVEADNITLDWTQVGSPTLSVDVVRNGNTMLTVNPTAPPLTLYDLSPKSTYTFRLTSVCGTAGEPCSSEYIDSVSLVTPPEAGDCVDPAELDSPNASFTFGTYDNPFEYAGVVDYGADSALSRHTVCTDTAARDPRTGGLLRVVPEDYTSSVRLGNWDTRNTDPGYAEAVTYSLFVDTASFQLLLLRYAAVLQDPNHAPEDQPRFRLQILDENYNEIDPECSSADFVANSALGWNSAADGVLWKDWTTVGIDLTDYANQKVYIRLITYDCNEGSHYGYAYFTLECMRKSLTTTTCGNVESNTLTAPAGFNYRWYKESAPTVTVGTEQSLTIPTEDVTYYCDLSKIDNASCSFTISAYGGTRYPMASFDTMMTVQDCRFRLTFVNTSGVSKDNVTRIEGEQCESAYWDFGNGQTATTYHGSSTYIMPGTYTVMLVSGIAGSECTDTAYMTFTLTLPEGMQPIDTTVAEICQGQGYLFRGGTYTQSGTYYVATPNPGLCDSLHTLQLTAWPSQTSDTTAEVCDSMSWRGSQHTASGNYTYLLPTPTIHGCDSSRMLHLTVHHSSDTVINDTVVENDLPYPVAGTIVSMANFDISNNPDHVGLHWTMHAATTHGCDSLIDFTLTVWRNRDTAFSATTCRNTLPYLFNGTPLNPTTNAATYTFNTTTTHGADSTITFTLYVVDNPTAAYSDTIVENQLPHTFRGISFNGSTDTTIIRGSAACDTIVHYTLHVWPNTDTTLMRHICRNQLPYQFDSAVFDSVAGRADTMSYADTIVVPLTDSHGADSTVTYIAHIGGIYEVSDTIVICPNRPYIYHGVDYGGPTTVEVMLSTRADCDSLVHVNLVPRDSNYRPATYYRFDAQPWETPDSLLVSCSSTTLQLWDTTPDLASRLWIVATADSVATSTDSLFSFDFPTSGNPTPAIATLITESNLGCIDTASWPVAIFRSPKADFIQDPEVPVMSHPETQFLNRSTLDSTAWSADSTYPLTYLWQIGSPTGDGDTSTALNPYYSWGEGNEGITGDADVTLTTYWLHTLDTLDFGPFDSISMASFSIGSIEHTCIDSVTHTVTITNDYLQFPNLVTPNDDGVNDTWVIVNLVEYGEYPTNELWIYNQWGALVYHVKNLRTEDQMWNPNATNSPDGAYYYRFTARGRFGITKRNGLIEVVR